MRCKIAKVRSKRQYLTMFLTSNFQEDLKLILYGIIHYKVCLVSHIDPFLQTVRNAQSFKILKSHDQAKPKLKCRTFLISIALTLCIKEKDQTDWLGIRIMCLSGGDISIYRLSTMIIQLKVLLQYKANSPSFH